MVLPLWLTSVKSGTSSPGCGMRSAEVPSLSVSLCRVKLMSCNSAWSLSTSVAWMLIAGRNGLEDPVTCLAHGERHGHAFHQAGNVLVSDGQLASRGIDRHHAAFQLIALGRRSLGTGGQEKQEE